MEKDNNNEVKKETSNKKFLNLLKKDILNILIIFSW